MKKVVVKKQVKSQLMWILGAVLVVVVGLGFYAVRNDKLDQQWWQYDDPEMSEIEQEYRLGMLDGEGVDAEVNEVTGSNAGAGSALFNCNVGTTQWPVNDTKGDGQLPACETSTSTQGECVEMVVAPKSNEKKLCQKQRDSISSDLGLTLDPSTASRNACHTVAVARSSWKEALPTKACQPGLLFNQLSITSDKTVDKYTGKVSQKAYAVDISNMHKCIPGLAGRKHPVATNKKTGEVVNLDPGKPGKTNAYSSNPGKSMYPDKGLQANLDGYRAAGYEVKWVEYKTVEFKGACECVTERPAVIKSNDKVTIYCAKTGTAQIEVVGSSACHKNSKPQFCCPAGKKVQQSGNKYQCV